MLLDGFQLLHAQHVLVGLVGHASLHHAFHGLHAHVEIGLKHGVLLQLCVDEQQGEVYLFHTVVDVIHRNVQLARLYICFRFRHAAVKRNLSSVIDGLLHRDRCGCHEVFRVDTHHCCLAAAVYHVGETVASCRQRHLRKPRLGGIGEVIAARPLYHAVLPDGRIVLPRHAAASVEGEALRCRGTADGSHIQRKE